MPVRTRQRVEKLVAAFRSIPHGRYVATLTGLFVLVVLGSCDGAYNLSAWWLENGLVAAAVAYLAWSYRRLPLSRVSYTMIFIFLCLHEIGAHWTYARVPYDDWLRAIFGTNLRELTGLDRNYYDRLVHFSYGLLMAYPIREIFLRVADVRGFWGYFLPLDVTMSTSMVYELLEWIVADVFSNDLGTAFLATQGDVWDAQKDMACATVGAIVALTVAAAAAARYKRDFAREFMHSFKVKRPRPLGEEALPQLQREVISGRRGWAGRPGR